MLRAENMLENTVEMATQTGFHRASAQHFFLERYEAAYQAEILNFIEALTTGTAPAPTIADGLHAQPIADAAAQSLRIGQPVAL